ncbi:MAG TPA: hypothetical protein VGB96_00930, partial [Archangium sp.]
MTDKAAHTEKLLSLLGAQEIARQREELEMEPAPALAMAKLLGGPGQTALPAPGSLGVRAAPLAFSGPLSAPAVSGKARIAELLEQPAH